MRKILDSKKIPWSSDRLLTWDDFKGDVDVLSKHDALSKTRLSHKTHFDPVQKTTKIKLKINWTKMDASFIPDDSWVKPQKRTNQLLKHEQGHFDIQELVARETEKKLNQKFNGKLITTNYASLEEADKDPKQIITKKIKKEIKIIENNFTFSHDKYDAETDHGRKRQKQIEYNRMFAKLRQ